MLRWRSEFDIRWNGPVNGGRMSVERTGMTGLRAGAFAIRCRTAQG